MKTVLSGIQPSGNLTLGNYIGAIKNFVKLQEAHDCYFMVVDLHAITVPQEPNSLRDRSESVAALYVAAGIDPNRANIFLQSHVPQHAELGWIMTTLVNMGELERMTQFKDKSEGKDSVGAGYSSIQRLWLQIFCSTMPIWYRWGMTRNSILRLRVIWLRGLITGSVSISMYRSLSSLK